MQIRVTKKFLVFIFFLVFIPFVIFGLGLYVIIYRALTEQQDLIASISVSIIILLMELFFVLFFLHHLKLYKYQVDIYEENFMSRYVKNKLIFSIDYSSIKEISYSLFTVIIACNKVIKNSQKVIIHCSKNDYYKIKKQVSKKYYKIKFNEYDII